MYDLRGVSRAARPSAGRFIVLFLVALGAGVWPAFLHHAVILLLDRYLVVDDPSTKFVVLFVVSLGLRWAVVELVGVVQAGREGGLLREVGEARRGESAGS